MWSEGDTVLWRSVEGAGKRIWHAVAATLVELTEEQVRHAAEQVREIAG